MSKFNLSHTHGLVACAIATHYRAIGVDVERAKLLPDLPDLCRYTFSPIETTAILSASSPADQRQLFFTYWTLKESYIKARGMGLSLPLQAFSLIPKTPDKWYLHYDESFPKEDHDWQLSSCRLEEHYLAYCIQRQCLSNQGLIVRFMTETVLLQ